MRKQEVYGRMVLALALLPGWGAARAEVTVNGTPSWQHGGARSAAQPGYLGVDVRDVAEEQVSQLKLKDAKGAEITRVDHDGPAGKMGLREHDVVVQMNGMGIEGEDPFRRMLHECAPGRTVALVILRDGQQLTMTAQLADKAQVEKQVWTQHLAAPAGPQAPPSALPSGDDAGYSASAAGPSPTSRYSKSFLGTLLPNPSYTGLMLERMGPQLAQFFGSQGGAGLLVRSVVDNSPAAMAGLKAGDVVVRANAQKVASMSDWTKAIHDARGRPVTVVVLRDKQERSLMLTPDSKKRSELQMPYEPEETIRVARGAAL